MNILTKTVSNINREMRNMYNTFVGVISSVSGNGKTINAEVNNSSEMRDMKMMTPYGISSSPVDGVLAQIVINNNQHNSVVGIYDDNKPDVVPGEVIIYNNYGTKITMGTDGNIAISIESNHKLTINGKAIYGGDKAIVRDGDSVSVDVPGIGVCSGTVTASSTILVD